MITWLKFSYNKESFFFFESKVIYTYPHQYVSKYVSKSADDDHVHLFLLNPHLQHFLTILLILPFSSQSLTTSLQDMELGSVKCEAQQQTIPEKQPETQNQVSESPQLVQPQVEEQPVSQPSTQPQPQPQLQPEPQLEPQQLLLRNMSTMHLDLVHALTQIGFPETRVLKALLLSGFDPNEAIIWLLEHTTDTNADEPLTMEQVLDSSIRYQNRRLQTQNLAKEIEECVRNNICTYTVTKRDFKTQKWFHCFTCGFVDSEGICESCYNVCHRGHELSQEKGGGPESGFYCDCGASGLCRCCS
eukprot:TRINITY_DN1714_c0_g3_i3.p1 TRINITY_DN1714_c0_g3~~TRINITY_DN1714_c0_g3_i3.p1  ORF type:complete len:302 (-),score=52.17 TRINITY_DN1714_c0_g3_i3:129-1034(-)